MKKTVIICACLLIPVRLTLAYGPQGHQAIAELARTMLTDKTRTAITNILGNDDLAAVATWADDVRAASRGKGPLAHDTNVMRFNAQHPGNNKWHYANLPLGTTNYTDNGSFSATNDVVHVINNCVAVLESKSMALSKPEALRVLVHMVGDVHQPLHVGAGFYQIDDSNTVELVTDPAQAAGKPTDAGGNDLFYGSGMFDELHAYWDGVLVEKVAGTSSYHKLVPILSNIVDRTTWKTPGSYHQWAEKWAGASVKEALAAYQGLIFSDPVFNTHNELRKISITLPANYLADQTPRAELQLAKGGFHLADLLNHIKWKAVPIATSPRGSQ